MSQGVASSAFEDDAENRNPRLLAIGTGTLAIAS
jgi:hypothetical protein